MINYIVSIIGTVSFLTVAMVVLFLRECEYNFDEILPWLKVVAIAGVLTLICVYLVCVDGI